MAMTLGAGRGPKAEMNVTPMIDVLLVLIIIFMVIMPSLSTGLNTDIPQNPTENSKPPVDDIVISVLADETVRINEETVALGDLEDRLKAIFKNAANHVIFVRGDKSIDFDRVAQVIDIAKGAGLDRVALMTH